MTTLKNPARVMIAGMVVLVPAAIWLGLRHSPPSGPQPAGSSVAQDRSPGSTEAANSATKPRLRKAGRVPGKRGEILRRQLGERGLTLAPFGRIQGTLVLVHGRMGRKEDYLPIAVRLCAAGFRCLIPDLPGHGDHPLPIATYGVREAGLPARVMEEAAREFRFEPGPAGLMGMSMGGSIAMHAADQPEAPWRALVVVASFVTDYPIYADIAEWMLRHVTGLTPAAP